LRYPASSLPTERLRHLPTAATHSGRLTPPPAALPSFPGIEPVRILLRGILSPLCLPIPPQRHIQPYKIYETKSVCDPCCDARCSRRRRRAFLAHRSRPLARLPVSATGSGRLAPHHSGIYECCP